MTPGDASSRSADAPSLLLITPGALNFYRESGVTLTNLLRGWPHDRIAQIHADPSGPMAEAALPDVRWFDVARASRQGSYHPIARRLNSLARFALGQSEHGLIWARLSPRLRAWLDEVRPDVIVSQTGNLSFLRLTRKIARYTGAPVVLYAADDWVADWPASNLGRRLPPLTTWLAHTVRTEFAALARESVAHFTIGEAMSEEYERRYGVPWGALPNPLDLDQWPRRVPKDRIYDEAHPFRILYSGSLHVMAAYSAVRELADAVTRLYETGVPIRLEIATHTGFEFRRSELERLPAVTFGGLVPQDEYRERLAAADLLVVPIVFDPEHLPYIGLSMPGKVSEYLASGTPTLVYADASTAVARHARTRGWGEVVSERGTAPLAAAIDRLRLDYARRAALASRAYEVAEAEFNSKTLVAAFQAAVRGAAARRAR